jgi:hypothetical protein
MTYYSKWNFKKCLCREILRSPLLVQQSNYSFDRDQIICGAAHQAALKRG